MCQAYKTMLLPLAKIQVEISDYLYIKYIAEDMSFIL